MKNRSATEQLLYALRIKQHDFITNSVLANPTILTLPLQGKMKLLELAAELKDFDLIEFLLTLDVINIKDEDLDLDRVFPYAVKKNRLKLVKLLLKNNISCNATFTESGNSALHIAVENKNKKMIYELLKADVALVIQPNKKGHTPLTIAYDVRESRKAFMYAWNRYIGELYLTQQLTSVTNAHPVVFIRVALLNYNYEQIINIAKQCPDFFTHLIGNTPLFWLCKIDCRYDLLNDYSDRFISEYEKKKDLNNALLVAVLTNKLEKTKELLQKAASPNTVYPDNTTLFYQALKHGSEEIVLSLLHAKVRLSVKDKEGNTLLSLLQKKPTLYNTFLKIFKKYCSEITNQELLSKLAPTPDLTIFLQLALETGQFEIIKKLISESNTILEVKIFHQDREKPLIHYLAVNQHFDLVNFIAALKKTDAQDTTEFICALFYAVEFNKLDSVKLLLKTNITIPGEISENNAYFKSLALAITKGEPDIIFEFLCHINNPSLELVGFCIDKAINNKGSFAKAWIKYYEKLKGDGKLLDVIKTNPFAFAKAALFIEDGKLLSDLYTVYRELVNLKDNRNFSIVQWLVRDGKFDLLNAIITNPFVAFPIRDLNQALLHTVHFNLYDLTEKLLIKGADPNSLFSVTEKSALHVAAKNNNAQMIALLLCHGGDLTMKDAHGETPATMSKGAYKEVVKKGIELFHLERATIFTPYILQHGQKQPSSNVSMLPNEMVDKICSFLLDRKNRPLNSTNLIMYKTKETQTVIDVEHFIKDYKSGFFHSRSKESQQLCNDLETIIKASDNKTEAINQKATEFVRNNLKENVYTKKRAVELLFKHHLVSSEIVEENPTDKREWRLKQ